MAFDVTDPSAPVRRGYIDLGLIYEDWGSFRICVDDGIAVVNAIRNGEYTHIDFLICDVTDVHHPRFLCGAADLQVQGGLGVYLSYFTELPARCIAIEDDVMTYVIALDPQ